MKNILKFKPGKKSMGQSGVYSISSDNLEILYIGSTKNFANRLAGHICDCKRGKGNRILAEFVEKHGWAALSFSILEVLEDHDSLKTRENYWIDKYGFENITNLAPDATSQKGTKMPDSHKKKSSERMIGNTISKGYKFKPEKGIKTALYWETHPEEKEQMIAKNRESQNKIDRSSWEKGKIIEVKLNNVVIDECIGSQEVYDKYPIGHVTISKLLTGKKESFNNYTLKYIGTYFKNNKICKKDYEND